MIAWWTNRGFLALVTLIGVFGLFGAVVTLGLGEEAFARWPWLWGVGLLLPAVVNWLVGCRLNRAPLNPLFGRLTDRLFYRARNRFMSFPLEAWSYPLAAAGVVLLVIGILRP